MWAASTVARMDVRKEYTRVEREAASSGVVMAAQSAPKKGQKKVAQTDVLLVVQTVALRAVWRVAQKAECWAEM